MTYLIQLPGFGVLTAMTVLSAIGEIGRFETPKHLASYSGLTLGLEQSGTKYLIVNGFLVALDLMAGGGLGFSIYSIVGWGLGLAMQARRTYGPQGEEYDSRFQKWRRNRAIKQSVNGLVNRILPTSP